MEKLKDAQRQNLLRGQGLVLFSTLILNRILAKINHSTLDRMKMEKRNLYMVKSDEQPILQVLTLQILIREISYEL